MSESNRRDPGAVQTSAEFVSNIIDRGRVRAQHVLIVALCILFNMVDGFDITAMAVVASTVADELQLAPDKLGWIFSFALAGMMAGAMLLAPLADIIGRRRLIIFSIAVVAVSILLTANATTLAEFVLLRFISGIGAGAMLACQATLAAEYSPEKFRSLAVVAVTSGYPLGAMLTSVVAAVVLPDYGWRGMFWFGGVVTLLMAVVAWAFIPESLKYLLERRPDAALARVNAILGRMRVAQLDALPALSRQVEPGDRKFLRQLTALMGSRHRDATVKLWFSFFLCFASLYFLMSWIPKLMEDSGYDAEVGRDAFFLFNLGGVIGIYVLGALATRWHLTSIVCGVMVSTAAAMLLFALVPDRQNLLLVLIFLIGALQQGGLTGLYAAAAKSYPTIIRTTGVGWAIGLGRSGAVAGPALAGYFIAAGLDMPANFMIFAVPMILSGMVAFRLNIR